MKKPLLKSIAVLVLPFILLLAFGCNKNDISVPSLQTNGVISNVTDTSAQSGGSITNLNGATLTALGVCWSSTNQNPTVADSKTSQNVDTIDYVSNLTKLKANTTYYVRAYATNSKGTNYGSVLRFTTLATGGSYFGTVSTYAGNGTAGYADGSAASAEFNNPNGVVADAQGNLYVTDAANHVIRKITNTGVVSTFAGNGTLGYAVGAGSQAEFYSPAGIALDSQGNLYVSDAGNNIILKITTDGTVSNFAGSGSAGIYDGAAATAQFNSPQGLAVDAQGNVYVADRANNRIRKITQAGVVSTISGTGYPGYYDGDITVAMYNNPTGLTIDAQGNLYVADSYNHSIREISAGVSTTVLGNPLQAAIIPSPSGIARDSNGNIFITDNTGRVLELNTASILYTLGGTLNTSGFADGTGGTALFYAPSGLTVYNGNVYVADVVNNRIRKIVP